MAMAVRTSIRAARRAGRTAATIPASSPPTRMTASWPQGSTGEIVSSLKAITNAMARTTPMTIPRMVPNTAMMADSQRIATRI